MVCLPLPPACREEAPRASHHTHASHLISLDPQQPTLRRACVDRPRYVGQPPRSAVVERGGGRPLPQRPEPPLALAPAKRTRRTSCPCRPGCERSRPRSPLLPDCGAPFTRPRPVPPRTPRRQVLSQCRLTELGASSSQRPPHGSPAAAPPVPDAPPVPKVSVPVGGMPFQACLPPHPLHPLPGLRPPACPH